MKYLGHFNFTEINMKYLGYLIFTKKNNMKYLGHFNFTKNNMKYLGARNLNESSARDLNFPNTSYPDTIPWMCFLSPQEQDCLPSPFVPSFKRTLAGSATGILYLWFTLILYWGGTRSQSKRLAAPTIKERYIGTDYISFYLIYLTIPISCLITYDLYQCTNYTCTIPPIFP